MSRLIDADALIEKLVISHTAHSQNAREASLLNRDVQMVIEQPTAYDVDVVVEQLEGIANMHRDLQASAKLSSEDRFRHALLNGLSMTMIDIVRKGGKE